MRRVGIIGCGKIGRPVITALEEGNAGANILVAVLSRQEHQFGGITSIVDKDVFFQESLDLIIDVAYPDGLHEYGVTALHKADVWTVNATALVEETLRNSLQSVGKQSGHRLRILSGAIAGLDGLAAVAVDPAADVSLRIDLAPSADGRKVLFQGSVREAAEKFPESVNVSVAAALTGVGLDQTQIQVLQPAPEDGRSLGLVAKSKYGYIEITSVPAVQPDKGIHTVSASIIAALRQEDDVIQVY